MWKCRKCDGKGKGWVRERKYFREIKTQKSLKRGEEEKKYEMEELIKNEGKRDAGSHEGNMGSKKIGEWEKLAERGN